MVRSDGLFALRAHPCGVALRGDRQRRLRFAPDRPSGVQLCLRHSRRTRLVICQRFEFKTIGGGCPMTVL